MKINIYRVAAILFSIYAFFSCEDVRFGNALLDQSPEETGINKDTMFSKKFYAMQVLTKAYTSLPTGIPENINNTGSDMLHAAVSDICFSSHGWGGAQTYYYNGAYSASYKITDTQRVLYPFVGGNQWEGIRYAWIFAENVDRVPDMTSDEKKRSKAEAKVIVALHYSDMLRHFGGLPWIDHAIKVNELHEFPRQTLEVTVNNIVNLLDQAIPDLEWRVADKNDNGRMTQAFAMGLKLRVLLMAASPLFNDQAPYLDGAASTGHYVWYGNYDVNRWKRAEKAGEEFMELLVKNGQYDLVQPTTNTSEAKAKAFQDAYFLRDNGEVLLSTRKRFANIYGNEWCGSNNYSKATNPTLEYVNMFGMSNGDDFPADFDWNNVTTDPFANRDPRFQETVLTNGRSYMGRKCELYIGGLDRQTAETPGTGFLLYKFAMDRTTATSSGRPDSWPYMRLPEVLLSYAETINEANLGPNDIAYALVNRVRNRVGLSDLKEGMDQVQFREAVLRERACELGFEEVRWYDLVRWKREDLLKAQLKGLNMYKDSSKPTGFRYEVFDVKEGTWKINWTPKWYLSAFPTSEINKNYGLVQNPGW